MLHALVVQAVSTSAVTEPLNSTGISEPCCYAVDGEQ